MPQSVRLGVRCRSSDAERVLAELLELAPGGVEEVSEPDGRAATVEYAIYGAPGDNSGLMLQEPHVRVLAAQLKMCIERARTSVSPPRRT